MEPNNNKNNNNNNNNTDKAEWETQLVMQNNFISLKNFEDTLSKPVEVGNNKRIKLQ